MKTGPQAILGGIVFDVDTFPLASISFAQKYRWAALNRIAAPVAIQFVGDGEHDITLNGQVNHVFHQGGMMYLDSLKAIAKKGRPVPFIFVGRNIGEFSVLDVNTNFARLLDNGKAIENNWSVKLKEYRGS